MEVIFTPDIFSAQSFGGVSRYFAELIRRLPAARVRPLVAAGLHRNAYLHDVPGVLGWHTRRAVKRRWLNERWCEALCCWHPKAIVHETFYHPRPYSRKNPVVLTVYDMIDETWGFLTPDPAVNHRLSAAKRAACERATHLIAISEATKTDLVRIFDLDPAKVTVVHLATSFTDLAPLPPVKRDPARRASLLYVGPRAGYKNFACLREAYVGSRLLRDQFDLVCFGGPDFDETERRRFEQLGVGSGIRWQGGGDVALVHAYRTATAYVCPSLYEGFGIPVLEAMSLGCPVFCARTAALEEVAGEAAGYFDPHSSEDLRATLESGLFQTAELAGRAETGRRRVQEFGWDKCAAETLQVYRKIA